LKQLNEATFHAKNKRKIGENQEDWESFLRRILAVDFTISRDSRDVHNKEEMIEQIRSDALKREGPTDVQGARTMADRLQDGQRLNINDKLVSPNGRYTLLMQADGNLVLYHDSIDVSTAYWSTDTWWLPDNERPAYALMQGDAHFVLYDANGVPRWASGTWGPGYVAPYIVLQDDGNLIIYHDGNQPVWASGGVGGVGAIPAQGYLPASAGGDLNAAVDRLGRLPTIVAGSTDLGPPTATTVDANGVAYHVMEQRRRLVNDVIEHAFLQDIAAMGVWPGQVIQGKALLVGDVAPIGPFVRQPGKLQIVTDLISNTPQPQSADLDNPDAAKVNQARRDILNKVNPAGSAGLLKAGFERASTLREVGVKLGVSVKGSAFGVDANATLDQTYKRSVVVASIRQVFYTVTFTPHSAGATGFWPEGDVSYQDLEPYVGVGNPPLYIDSVQYGRFICVTAQGAFSSSDITGALQVSWKAAVSGDVNIDARSKEVLESSQVKIYTLGVPGRENFQNLADPINELQQVYKSGLTFTLQNPGAPISFTCRHIADGALSHVGLAAEYTQPLSAQGENVSQRRFEVFDGPGGGLVDTRIRVNPGDTATLSSRGEIWSGVIFSGTHGPEGWPGHRADPAAPLPQGTAYCLVHRFGTGRWIEAGRFWEGSPEPGGGGMFLLNVNDNNPYNGNPANRWEVYVDVKRAGAAAAGVYV
jgi:hypothetical protein